MNAYERLWALYRLESAIQSAMQAMDFWEQREKTARIEKPTWFAYIGACKKHRKKAEAEFQYQTQRLAHFVQENKIPYVLMSA